MKFEINIEKVLESVIEQLEEQGYKPAIHAKWIKTRNMFKCSDCDLIPRDANHKLVAVYPGWDYCPNCGARMDGDENDSKNESDKGISDNTFIKSSNIPTPNKKPQMPPVKPPKNIKDGEDNEQEKED